MCSLILFVNVNHTLLYLSHRPIFFRMEVDEKPFRYLAAESYHNLQKVLSTLKIKELHAFVRVADLNVINLTTTLV